MYYDKDTTLLAYEELKTLVFCRVLTGSDRWYLKAATLKEGKPGIWADYEFGSPSGGTRFRVVISHKVSTYQDPETRMLLEAMRREKEQEDREAAEASKKPPGIGFYYSYREIGGAVPPDGRKGGDSLGQDQPDSSECGSSTSSSTETESEEEEEEEQEQEHDVEVEVANNNDAGAVPEALEPLLPADRSAYEPIS